MIVLLFIAYGLIAVYDIPFLVDKKYWKELIVFVSLSLLGLVVTALIIYGVKIPSPVLGIQYIIKDVLHLAYPEK